MLISECGKREVQNAFRKQWKKYLSVSVYGKRKTENGIGKKTVLQTVKLAPAWDRAGALYADSRASCEAVEDFGQAEGPLSDRRGRVV